MIKSKCLFAPVEESDGTRIIISGIPKGGYSLFDEHYPELAPTQTLLYDYKYHELPWKEYEIRFHQLMQGRRAIARIQELAARSQAGEVITLLCYEQTDEKCHRRLVKDLIEQCCEETWGFRKKLFLIDGYLHLHRAFHAPIGTTLTSPSGEPVNCTYIFMTALLKLIREQEPDALVVAMEGKCKPFRNELYAEYKANRTYPTDDFILQRDRVEAILAAMHIPVLRVDGFEADDIIGTVSKKAQADGYEVFICSTDKDMSQLLDHDIHMFDMKTGKLTDVQGLVEKIGVSPEKFIDYLALQGDPGDNIPGIPGIGPKTAMGLIRKYGSIKNLMCCLDELSERHRTNLIKYYKDRLVLGIKLVTIDCDVPIEVDYSKFDMTEFDKDKLREIFDILGFNSLIAQLNL